MIFSICLLINSGLLYLFHFLVRLTHFSIEKQLISLLMGCGLVGMILSTACFFMNMGNIDLKNKKRYIWWMIVSAIAFTVYLGYIVFCLIERARMVGISF